MKLINWEYSRRYNIKAVFDLFPGSLVIFRQIQDYYFVYIVNWSEQDPVVAKSHLLEMKRLLNEELGTLEEYNRRKIHKDGCQINS
ncbi:hypothetical protein [Bacillus marinisedimentorum]|uniref:hypothetical protein n=1 Tax=Bacillus marinisedimentorum TaxID=1821260 RepID=UPI0007E291CF|nr:hypothetical protein [Bacillus marinisedimentorum]